MGSELSQRLFVYGTLKCGGSNHHWLEGAGWQGRARLAHHRLHDLGDYPMAVPGRGVVHGEVYGLDDAALARLDVLEDVPNEYQRRICRLEDGRQAWVYLGTPSHVRGMSRVPYDDWESIPVFCYGSDLDPGRLRSRFPAWDGTAWLARLPGWRWQAAADDLCRRGVTALIRPDPAHDCWGVVIHERHAEQALRRSVGGYAQGLDQIHPSTLSAGPARRGNETSDWLRAGGPGGTPQESRAAGRMEGGATGPAIAPAAERPGRGFPVWAGGPADGWRVVGLRLHPWHNGAHGGPVGAVARVWWPEAGWLPAAPGPAPEELAAKPCRQRLLAGAVRHGLPGAWCQFLRQALADSP